MSIPNFSYDGTTAGPTRTDLPQVHVPPPANPPNVSHRKANLTGYNSSTRPQTRPKTSHHYLPQEYGSYGQTVHSPPHDDEAFPRLGSTKPVVSLPKSSPVSKDAVLDVDRVIESTDLEARMRSMILKNNKTDGDLGKTADYVTQKPKLASDPPQSRRKANQAERKLQMVESRKLLAEVQQNKARTAQEGHIHQANNQPHNQRSRQISRRYAPDPSAAHYGRNGVAFQQTQPFSTQAQSTAFQSFHPPPHNAQLYNPNGPEYGRRFRTESRPDSFQVQRDGPTCQEQNTWLAMSIDNAVKASEISSEEYEATQQLKKRLEDACRRSVANFESQHNPDFLPSSVNLASFGSLATTFATKGSDMDLVLLSPDSVPDASSIDSPLPRLIEKTLLDMGHGARLLTRTRVPIIKFCEKPTPDLAQRLCEARKAWEEEIDALPPKQKPKGRKSKAENPPKHDELGSTEPKPALSSPSEPIQSSIGTWAPEGHQPLNIEKSGADSGNLLSSPGATFDTIRDKPPAEQTLICIQRPQEHIKVASDSEDRHDLERDDPSIASKSDEERAKLYRLAMKEDWYEPHERNIILNFIEAFETGAWESALSAAREKLQLLPNILKRYRPPHEKHLEFPKDGVGIQCDINFSNQLALHNSTLLRCYSLCDSRVRPMVLFIKTWAKTRKINSAYESTLSSYGYVLMVLHYLVNVAFPPVLPNLQHFPMISEDETSLATVTLEGRNIQFYRNEARLKELAAQGQLTANRDPLEILVRSFFAYYGSEGLGNYHWMRDCLSLRTPGGLVSKQNKGWTAAKTEIVDAGPGSQQTKDIRQRYLVAIEDPFEVNHNVGRTVNHDGIVAIRDEFRRAHRLIQTAGIGLIGPEQLLTVVERKGNVHHRYFGPRPWKKDVKPTSGNAQATNV